ncbi:hypothetical protein MSIMFB_03113 [Mycobacterium simulans]|uniref:Uncharacterized protein n=1 Tax=Mycobacterium simulans TaxID=627089 RepID=A0A7Z7NAA2_9MYCO|nr:hypothetical protein MSIMFB_03113 [Mycobacterium simulans]
MVNPTKACVGNGCRRAAERQNRCRWDEIDGDPGRLLPPGPRASIVLQDVHRKSLMPQRVSYLTFNVLTKIGNCRRRQRPQCQQHEPANHPGDGLGLRADAPADREIERHVRPASTPLTHQKRARRSNHRRATDPQFLAKLVDSIHYSGVQLNWGRGWVEIRPIRDLRQLVSRTIFSRKILAPISPVFEVFAGLLIF